MNESLTIFEGESLEILTKEDVNINFDGTVLFNGKQSAILLKYSNTAKAIGDHVDDDCKLLLKNSDITKRDFRKLNNAGEMFLTEDGVFDLIYNSKLPKAKDFKKKVKQIVKTIQQTGKYDAIEENLKLIEDDKERELSLGLYSLQQAQKVNPTDLTLSILINQKSTELNVYKHQNQLELQQRELAKLKDKTKEQDKKIDNMFVIGDRVQFVRAINNVSRSTGTKQSEVYGMTYAKLKDLYSIDLETRSKNRKEEIQKERLESGKKPYSPDTLNNKAGKLVVANELNIFQELSISLNAVRNDLLA